MTRTTALATFLLMFAAISQAADPIPVADFIEDTGVRESGPPVRERPGWQPGATILVNAAAGITDGLADDFPAARLVFVEGTDDALAHARSAAAMIGFCTPEVLDAAPKLVWVQVYWAGVEGCLANEVMGSGQVLLTNMQKMSSPTIGEHAIALMLSLTRGLTGLAKHMEDGEWRRADVRQSDVYSVDGKTVLVAGLGGIGKQVARRAKALGMRVVATRNSSRQGPAYVDYVGLSDELLALAREADVVVNALPLTEATAGLFDATFFATVKPGSYFINVGRGGTVVTDALRAALDSGRIAGAGLDVTDPEPLPADHPLWQMSNVIITPHVASVGGSRRWHAMLVRENLRRYLAGEALLNVVDPERGY